MCTGGKGCIITGGILITLGLIVGIGWLFGCVPLIESIADKKLRQQFVVDSPNAEGYKDWVSETAARNWNFYVYSFWNLTNLPDVMKGAKPAYEEVGPFYYRYYWYNTNATFSEGGNKVAYSLLEDYIFEKNMSVGDPTQMYITNINPAYLGLLYQAGAESLLCGAAMRPQLIAFMDFLTGPYLDIVYSQYAPPQLSSATAHIIDQIHQQNSSIDGEEYFYETWANCTDTPAIQFDDWQYFLVSKQGGPASGLSLDTVQQLFNSSTAFSLLDGSADGVMTWYMAFMNASGDEANNLSQLFDMSLDQVAMVAEWRTKIYTAHYVPDVLMNMAKQVYPNATDKSDIGWVQYVHGIFTQPTFVDFYNADTTWFPQYPSPFEFAPGNNNNMTVDDMKNVFNGPYGIFNVNNYQDFMNALPLHPEVIAKWNITPEQASDIVGYIMGDPDFLGAYAIPIVQSYIDDYDDGLFATRSVDYLLWQCLDPLVSYIAGAANASCTLQFNHTYQPFSQIWTGKDDEKKINQFVYWRNQTQITDLYAHPIPVQGCAENGQFALRLKKGENLQVFDESFYKTINLIQLGKENFREVETYKYILDDHAFDISPLYYNKIQGFFNVSAANQGVPVFLSNWDMYNADKNYTVAGMKPDKNNCTMLWVEPFTGNTVKADMKLQVNFYMPPNKWFEGIFEPSYKKVSADTMFPLMKAWQKSEVGDEDHTRLVTQLKPLQPSAINGLRFGIVGGAVGVVIIGVILVLRGKQLSNRRGYINISDSNIQAKKF